MKPIATSTSDFADLITSGGIYVDKTGYFHRLVSNRLNKLLFFARPRRFGKSLMKDRTGAIRFLMMTGVSKFTKMSVFSGLNNIVDISMDEEYATMLGYTEEELEANFEEHLREHAERMLAIDPEHTKKVTERAFDVTNLADLKPIGMLFQTGYLTIKDYAAGLYTLGVPDDEVRQDFNLLMASVAAHKQIREKGYAAPYLDSGQPIHLIGLSFDPETRHLVDAVVEPY